MKTKQETFYSCEEKERIAFESIVHKFERFYENRNQKMEYYLVYNNQHSHFDVIMNIHSEEGNKIESNIIEVKIRNEHYNDLLLERGKYNRLKNLQKKQFEAFDKVNILYINFTPKSTYLFNLDKVTLDWTVGKFNKSWVIDKDNKVDKKVAMLDIIEASDMHYIFDPKTSNKKYIEQINKQKRLKCIFESVERLK